MALDPVTGALDLATGLAAVAKQALTNAGAESAAQQDPAVLRAAVAAQAQAFADHLNALGAILNDPTAAPAAKTAALQQLQLLDS
jgi:archaellum component FlaG (FlaF/FlaG flagellin family)